ncbi:MAG: orotidine-5'-phosphate decarboxylase [Limnobacter sp.]|nr:orotidine-5'-phosphate decarboxylase [Limnobacter sp.]
MSFVLSLEAAWQRSQSLLCVGLDPDPARMPASIGDSPDGGEAVLRFCRGIVDATARWACAFKPQIAYFAAVRAEAQLEALIDYVHDAHPGIPVVLDAKRGDIGATAEQYAIEAFERYGADAVTVNPFMGFDSIEPYLRGRQRGVFVLCRTSNPGGSDLQALDVGGELLYERVARLAAGPWNTNGQLGLVVGATFPDELARVRALVGEMPLLVPGIGAQGGDIEKTVRAGATAGGRGMLVNSSRAILYASPGADWAEAAAAAARETRDALRAAAVRHRIGPTGGGKSGGDGET